MLCSDISHEGIGKSYKTDTLGGIKQAPKSRGENRGHKMSDLPLCASFQDDGINWTDIMRCKLFKIEMGQ